MKKPLFLILLFLLSACRQEVQTNAPLPVVTSAFVTASPTWTPQPTPVPATATPLVFSAPMPLPPGPVSIIALGDDLTQGVGDESGRGYPGRLLEIVTQIRPEATITNFGQAGWDSGDVLIAKDGFPSQLERALTEVRSSLAENRGAVVLVWVGSNDLWELYTGIAEVTAEQEQADLQRFSTNIADLLKALRTEGAQVILAKLDDQSLRPARTRGETYPDITAAELERMSAQVTRYNEVITAQAETYGALTVDFSAVEFFTQFETLADDGYHPNAAGYDLIAQAWYKVLSTLLP